MKVPYTQIYIYIYIYHVHADIVDNFVSFSIWLEDGAQIHQKSYPEYACFSIWLEDEAKMKPPIIIQTTVFRRMA